MQKDASTVPAAPGGKQQHVVEILHVVDMGTSLVVAAQVHAQFHAQTALEAMAQILHQHGQHFIRKVRHNGTVVLDDVA